jgi:hypothetical protein
VPDLTRHDGLRDARVPQGGDALAQLAGRQPAHAGAAERCRQGVEGPWRLAFDRDDGDVVATRARRAQD